MKPEQLKYSILKKAFSGQLIMVDPDSEKPKVETVECEETPFDIPDDWFWSNLGNCCEIYTGNSISESVKKAKYAGLKEGYDYIATKDVSFEHTIEYDNGVRIPVDDNFRIAYNGSVLMCIEGGSAGRKIGMLDRDVCFGNKLCTFNSKEIINSYIYYYLQSHEFKAFFMDNMSGIIGGVSIKKLKGLPIPVPTVSEQKAIVARIEELFPYVDRYAEFYEKLKNFSTKFPEDMKKSILQYAVQGKLVEQRPDEGTGEELYQQIQEEKKNLLKLRKIKKAKPLESIDLYEKPFDIPESWKWIKIGDLAKKVTDGEHKTPKRVSEYCGYYLLSARNIINGNIRLDDVDYVDEEEYVKISERCNPQKGDVLISCSGTVGRCTSVKDDNKYVMVRSAAMVSPMLMDCDYLMYAIQSDCVQKQIKERTKQAVQANLFQDAIINLVIPIPPVQEQHRIVAKIEELLPYCDRLISE